MLQDFIVTLPHRNEWSAPTLGFHYPVAKNPPDFRNPNCWSAEESGERVLLPSVDLPARSKGATQHAFISEEFIQRVERKGLIYQADENLHAVETVSYGKMFLLLRPRKHLWDGALNPVEFATQQMAALLRTAARKNYREMRDLFINSRYGIEHQGLMIRNDVAACNKLTSSAALAAYSGSPQSTPQHIQDEMDRNGWVFQVDEKEKS